MRTLLIVESPNKARAVAQYARGVLQGQVSVRACFGHLRDLPAGELHVDVAHDFRPEYALKPDRAKVVVNLRTAIQQADRVFLATDPDQEGEAVAWHLLQVFQAEWKGKEVARVVFNAITREAIQTALRHPRPLDMPRVQAAIARRVMDRLFGYTLSPALWQGVKGRDLSAGRVQTAALRVLVKFEREAERQPALETWTVEVEV